MFLKIKNNALYIISFLKKKAILKLKLHKTDFFLITTKTARGTQKSLRTVKSARLFFIITDISIYNARSSQPQGGRTARSPGARYAP